MILSTPWANQPQFPTRINPYWARRGLRMVFAGNRIIYNSDAVPTVGTSGGTPKLVPFRRFAGGGVASGFGATYGTGTTDSLSGPTLVTGSAAYGRSVVAHVYKNGTGGGGFGRIFDAGNSGVGSEFYYTGATDFLIYQCYSQSQAAAVSWIAPHTIPTGAMSAQGMSLDLTVTGKAAAWYSNGGFTGTSNPSITPATYGTYTNTVVFGNRTSDNARCWDGYIICVLIFDGSLLSGQEHAALAANPWQVFAPMQDFGFAPSVAGGVTGTVAYANADDTSAASGTTTVVGSLAKTNDNDTSAASGTTTILGTLARTNANDTVAASGTTTVVGTLATTNANDTCAASGTVGTSGSTGTLATTNANDTVSAAGTTTVTGTLARTNANDTVSAAGWVGAITGTLAYTNADDSVSASGVATAPVTAVVGGGGWLPYQARRKTRKEVHAERVRLGILPPDIVKAAAKVAVKAETVAEFKADRPRYEEMFMRELSVTKWSPDYTRAIQAQLETIEQEEEDILLLM